MAWTILVIVPVRVLFFAGLMVGHCMLAMVTLPFKYSPYRTGSIWIDLLGSLWTTLLESNEADDAEG